MGIPESQFETWSHQGAVTTSSSTYSTLRTALESPKAKYRDKEYEIFLQGSYGNDTNIYSESDVDVVIRLDSIFRSEVGHLPAVQRAAYQSAFSAATYSFADFRDDVQLRLETAFGKNDVKPGNKAIEVKASGNRRKADVVVCYEYRLYRYFRSLYDSDYIPGIIFQSRASGEVINFPRLHSSNLTAKHQSTKSWFKPMVRIFKNMRTRLVEEKLLKAGVAPSYYIEGLLSNVPTSTFGGSYRGSFIACFNWIMNADPGGFLCAHEQYGLFGTSNVQWSESDFSEYMNGLRTLWTEW